MQAAVEMAHRWRLNEVLARYRVGTGELADQLGYVPQSVSKLKAKDTMPRIDGDTLAAICTAINKILREKGISDTITPGDLIEYVFDD
ncbi:helix-turn-helix domain-containing protein [Laspinema olomoucense]|uniref:Helix-turn-helix domain-containing protein n=1 Tax=Laspinema olomoucense D3b TaxID=2953688 RepID=A0ABT2NJS0_9CYAN|nr:helix-turn-helix domain-containing protein [Laspinema sp. D3b]MCT7981575.1 helix-turn-helix domain-containing protein [Laspinema sp. D3b]